MGTRFFSQFHNFSLPPSNKEGSILSSVLQKHFWKEDAGQDIAEYAVMLAVILVIVVGTVRLISSN